MPTVTLANGAALGATMVGDYDLPCLGFRRAIVHAICSETWDYYMLGRLQGMTGTEQLFTSAGARVEKTQITGATGVIVPVDIEGLDLLRVALYNNAGSPAAATVRVTLIP